MAGDDEPPIAVRAVHKLKRQLNSLASDIKTARTKGLLAQTMATERTVFVGMHAVLDSNFVKWQDTCEEALEYCEVNNVSPIFPTAEEQAQVKTNYYEAHGFFQQLKAAETRAGQPIPRLSLNQSMFGTGPAAARAILPKINIKPFKGDVSQWSTFKQLFTSLIKDEESLSDAERFHYLTSYLEGPAQDAIKHIQFSDTNFGIAWDALCKSFDDKRKIASAHIDKLLNFKPHSGKPTADSLQTYLSTVSESISALENMRIPDLKSYLLCELALKGLDPITREAFEMEQADQPFPNFIALKDFVQKRFLVYRRTGNSAENNTGASKPQPYQSKSVRPPNKFTPKSGDGQALFAHTAGNSQPATQLDARTPDQEPSFSCYVCKQPHILADCEEFKRASTIQRRSMLLGFEGCINCLYPYHKVESCKSKYSCRECKGKHHSTLHMEESEKPEKLAAQQSKPPVQRPAGFSGASTSTQQEVLLGTVRAKIIDSKGEGRWFRGVLDPGSQFSFVTRDCAKQLGRPPKPFQGSISGVNSALLKNIAGKITVSFLPKAQTSILDTEAVVVPTITPPLPSRYLQSVFWTDYFKYDLSDPEFNKPSPISFLIGADLFTDVLTGIPIVVHEQGPRLIETVFGFTIMGKFTADVGDAVDGVSLLSIGETTKVMERFWEIEQPSHQPPDSPEDKECEQHFIQTHRRTDSGRYVVSLPFKTPSLTIIPNVSRVVSRFYALEAKFLKDRQLREDYSAFMKEYIDLGHMSVATSTPAYMIPHHPVYKVAADGTRKIRVVFDASFRTPTGSLNEHLHTGPKLQADISNIILNFRRFDYVMTTDIVKCFRQILVEPADRKYQQIVWRFDPSEPLSYYELNTVTYGLRSSPYQSCRVLRALAEEEGRNYPAAAEILRENTYVDDCTFGANSISELNRIKTELIELLKKGGFELSKWNTNCPMLLDDKTISQTPLPLYPEEGVVTKILGIKWDPVADAFSYDVSRPQEGFTKRIILSIIARLFDPLGYLAPAVFLAKCILQQTWSSAVDWDETVPEPIRNDWSKFTSDFQSLSQISIPRAIIKSSTTYELLGFCDASERGYCAVAYLRATDEFGQSNLTLLKAKTVLAPLKRITLPRLELCGAVLLAELIKSLQPFLSKLSISRTFCFTDSTVALAWIKTPAHRLQTFVANRVQKTVDVAPPEVWFHIRGVDNPADAGSRGVLPSALKNLQLWWRGPEWCQRPISEWPLNQDSPLAEVPELKPIKSIALATVPVHQTFIDLTQRFSSFSRLIRVIAYIKRFIKNTRIPKRKKKKRRVGPISSTEYHQAHNHCIMMLQRHYYPEAFKESNDIPLEIRRLDTFIDQHGLLRVGGRLKNAPITNDHKHPVLLPGRSHVTNLIITHHHRQNHHIGPAALLAVLRQQYWIPRARTLLRLLKSKCITCLRFSNAVNTPFMGQLPKSRFENSRAFNACGTDFAGPFLCRQSSNPRAGSQKAYLCIFVCLASRAVHLELATSLSVEGFLDAFDRFAARRGLPSHMFSDNGTNYVGTVGYLKEIYSWFSKEDTQDQIIGKTSHRGIKWSFNPAVSPHMGGSWESNVKVAKSLLYKVFGQQPFTPQELATMFAKVEAIMNSRPLQPVPDSPEDAEALTPGHFLIGQPLNALPDPDFTEIPSNRLNCWQLLRERTQHFWQRWKEEYLSTLQVRYKWLKRKPNIHVGDIVIVKDMKTSPTYWPLARVAEVHPGGDGIVRVITLKTSRGEYKRSIVNVIPLPVLGNCEETP